MMRIMRLTRSPSSRRPLPARSSPRCCRRRRRQQAKSAAPPQDSALPHSSARTTTTGPTSTSAGAPSSCSVSRTSSAMARAPSRPSPGCSHTPTADTCRPASHPRRRTRPGTALSPPSRHCWCDPSSPPPQPPMRDAATPPPHDNNPGRTTSRVCARSQHPHERARHRHASPTRDALGRL